jgi:HTH-type transcriptional regulator/antitoxin HigA
VAGFELLVCIFIKESQKKMAGTSTPTRPVRKAGSAPIKHPIRTRKEFDRVVAEMDALLDADSRDGTPERDRLELLSILVAAYEADNEPEPHLPTPQAAVRFMAEQKGITATELANLLGGRSRLSEFFNEKRELSRTQIRQLRDALGIPADLLIG